MTTNNSWSISTTGITSSGGYVTIPTPIGNNPLYSVNISNPTPSIKADTIEVTQEITIQGIPLAETMKQINDRLAILVPDPKKLEKYEALKMCYEQYKMLEAMVKEND